MSNKTKIEDLCIAMDEAQKFLRKADAAIVRLQTDSMAYISGSREVAAAKRSSLDLSAALVEIRKVK